MKAPVVQTPRRPAADERVIHTLHILAALWMALLGVLIVCDVLGRLLFNAPIAGVAEIVAISVVGVAFLQIPYSIASGAMLRTTALLEALPKPAQTALEVLNGLLGALLFALIAYAAWEPLLHSWQTSEYEGGEGFRVPVYPVRTLLFVMAIVAAWCYLKLGLAALRGRRVADSAAH